jgi:hypothetical protein
MSSGATPQFHTKEVSSGADVCKFCGVPISTGYYRVGQAMACPMCAAKIRDEGPQSPHGAFAKAILLGIGAAIVGCAIYAEFTIVTRIEIAVMSLLVGFIVGKAMMLGSGGYGGRKYQIVAAVLTYMSVSLAFVPIAIHYYREHPTKPAHVRNVPNSTTPTPSGSATTTDSAQSTDSETSAGDSQSASSASRPAFGPWLMKVFMIGLASPFLGVSGNPLNALIGLVILFVGIKFAWKTAAGRMVPNVTGPY